MARKSASQLKASNKINSSKFVKQPELPPIEETFENAKQAFVNTAEVAVVIAQRVDNLINIRKAAYDFWGDEFNDKYIPSERITKLKDWQAMTVGCYEEILDIVHSFDLDEFLKDEMKDYFQRIMPTTNDIANDVDLFEAYLLSGIIKPWGEKMTSLHHTMLEEQAARKEREQA